VKGGRKTPFLRRAFQSLTTGSRLNEGEEGKEKKSAVKEALVAD